MSFLLTVISNMPFLSRLRTLEKALNANHVGMEGVELLQMEKAELNTFRDLPAHRDGEVFELKKGRYYINVLKNKIRLLVP